MRETVAVKENMAMAASGDEISEVTPSGGVIPRVLRILDDKAYGSVTN